MISAYAFVFGFCEYFHGDEFLGNQSIINVFLFAGAYLLLKAAFVIEDKRTKQYCGGFGVLLAVALVVGHTLYVENSIRKLLTVSGLAKGAISILGFATVLGAILALAVKQLQKVENLPLAKLWKLFRYPALLAVLMFMAWLPYYLAYYPGIFAYDIDAQTAQALGITEVTRFHPPLHTFFWWLCLTIERWIGIQALTIYAIAQMTALASAFAYVLCFLVKRGIHNGLILGSLLYFALNPVIAIFSFVPTKDATLAIFLTLYIVELCSFLADREAYANKPMKHVKLVIWVVLCCLLRNNMVYAIVIAGVFMVLLQEKLWKTVLLWCVSIVLGFGLINGPFYTLLGVKEGSSAEMLSVPMQQLACVVYYHEAELSEEDKAAIGQYLPVDELVAKYNYRFADNVKSEFNTERFDEAPLEFIKVWAKFLVRYPVEYVEAFLNLNLPYWYPDACSTDAISRRAYIEVNIIDTSEYGYSVVRDSKLPGLLEKIEKVASYEAFRTKPVIANVFSISTPIWILLICGLVLLIKKRKDMLLPLLPTLGLWMTFMLGPVSNLRYMFPIIVLYPLYAALILQTNRFNKIHKEEGE